MRELSLFTGAGGGLLGTHLLGWTPVGYVENDDYCQRVLAQRIQDGFIPEAPIFGDIRAFIREGYADSYQGMVDVVTAGFPCQPFSVIGKQEGEDDGRNMWPETWDAIRIIRPRFCFLENVPGLLADRYFGRILEGLALLGYGVRWGCIRASQLGAPHRRERLWIVADSAEQGLQGQSSTRLQRGDQAVRLPGKSAWGPIPSDLPRVDDGVAFGVDRTRATGNGQVPRVVQTAWEVLSE